MQATVLATIEFQLVLVFSSTSYQWFMVQWILAICLYY